MSTVEELWQERLTEARVKMSSAIKPETLAQRYDAETDEEIEELTNRAIKEMWRGDNGMVTLRDLDVAEEKLDEAGDYELATDGGIEGGPEYCPCCSVIGEKTPRVGTFKCTNSECRVRHYQQGLPQDAEFVTDGGQPVDGTYRKAALERGRPTEPCDCLDCDCDLHTYPVDMACIWCRNGNHRTVDTDTNHDDLRPDGGTDRDHIYVGRIPGMWKWSTDYDVIAEWAGGEENVTIMHKRGREYVLDLSEEHPHECSMNRRYDCGHVAYGPPRRLPSDCPECKPVATDGGRARIPDRACEWVEGYLDRLDMVEWDRFTAARYDGNLNVTVYGWIDRDDEYKDFVVVRFWPEHGENGHLGFTTSSDEYSQEIHNRLFGEDDGSGHNECRRVENTFDVEHAVELTDQEVLTDGGEDEVETDHEIRCYHCERIVDRRSVSMIETPIDHDEGLGYDMVPVPWCRSCQLEIHGHECDRCGRRHMDLEDALLCCDRELGPVPAGGERNV